MKTNRVTDYRERTARRVEAKANRRKARQWKRKGLDARPTAARYH